MDTNPSGTNAVVGRRRWPAELKRRIVRESREPRASVSIVARRYDVNANQLFRWRREHELSIGVAGGLAEQARLVPVEVRAAMAPAPVNGTIEIELSGSARVRTIGRVDADLLERVLKVLLR
nr:transposase [Chelatococcus reniformis]